MQNNKYKTLKRWGYVLLGIIIMMCLGTVYSYSVFRLPIEKLFNVGATQSGMPYMISLAFYAFFMFLTGKYLDKFNLRYIIIIGGLLVSLGWILSAYAPNIFVLTITYGLISGAGVGIVYGVPMTVVARWFPEKKGLAVGMVLIGFGLSPLITAPLARIFVEQYGIMNTFQILGICFGVIIPILSLPFKYPSDSELLNLKSANHVKNSFNDLNTSNMIKTKSFNGLYINFIIGTTIGLMLIGLTSSVGIELIGLSPSNVALLMGLFAIFNGIGRPTFGWLTDKLSSKNAMYLSYGLIISSAVLILFANEGDVTLYSISFSIFWFNLGGWLAIAPTSTLALYGTKHYSQNYGVVFTAYGIGAITGVVTSGILLDVLQNYQYVFYYVIALCLIGILITSKLIKEK
ncbi:MFS transporter [Dehalobacter sp. TeCB1]|nr:MFS transporter [Dehalobacter sp. TeCB1]